MPLSANNSHEATSKINLCFQATPILKRCPFLMASLWLADDFTVYANLLDNAGNTTTYLLTYNTSQQTNSLFRVNFDPPLTSNIKTRTFNGIQKNTGNFGLLQV